jgi:hypothetical protein
METGDLILYKESTGYAKWWLLDRLITKFTSPPWIHAGIVLKDPEWLGLKGLYVWEAGWTTIPNSGDRARKFGVQVVPLNDRIIKGSTYHRKYLGPPLNDQKLNDVYSHVVNKPYDIDPVDWVEAYIGCDVYPQKDTRCWGSALIGCILTKLGVLEADTDWSIVTLKDLSDPSLKYYGRRSKLWYPVV